MRSRLLAILFVLASATVALAQGNTPELTFSYGNPEKLYGTGKQESYDVAIQLRDTNLVGIQVRGLRIYMPQGRTEGLANLRGWLTRELTLEAKKNMPDIAEAEADIAEGWVEVRFDEPYTITGEGLYLGYSFDTAELNEQNKNAIALTTGANVWIHSSRTYRKWFSHPEMGALALQVILGGPDIHEHAASVMFGPVNAPVGHEAQAEINVVNYGSAGIRSFDYQAEAGGQISTGHVDLDMPVEARFGLYATAAIDLPVLPDRGTYPLTITVTRVNGADNQWRQPQSTQLLTAYSRYPKKRPLVEEYTGTWCQWCPRGIVGLEKMHELYPDEFICISYHNQDVMAFTSYYPSNVQSFPNCWIDRVAQVDAYYGLNQPEQGFGIDQIWQLAADVQAPADINVTTRWAADSVLEATAHVIFPVNRDDCPYELAFALLADSLTGKGQEWLQQNGFSGQSGHPEDFRFFMDAPSQVSGLKFNDVIIMRSGTFGIEGSLTAPIIEEQEQQYTYTFDLTRALNTEGRNMVQSLDNLRVVAMLLSADDGTVLNCNQQHAEPSPLAIRDISGSDGRTATAVFDLQGRRQAVPQSGRLSIVRTTGHDGSVHFVKQLSR